MQGPRQALLNTIIDYCLCFVILLLQLNLDYVKKVYLSCYQTLYPNLNLNVIVHVCQAYNGR